MLPRIINMWSRRGGHIGSWEVSQGHLELLLESELPYAILCNTLSGSFVLQSPALRIWWGKLETVCDRQWWASIFIVHEHASPLGTLYITDHVDWPEIQHNLFFNLYQANVTEEDHKPSSCPLCLSCTMPIAMPAKTKDAWFLQMQSEILIHSWSSTLKCWEQNHKRARRNVMPLINLLFHGGQEPQTTQDWIVFFLTLAFVLFAIAFMSLLGLTLFFGIIAFLERLMIWSL